MDQFKSTSSVELLDVTLRDGGYLNNWDFTLDTAISIVTGLYNAGVEYIEIGYRNCPPKESGVGITGICSNDYITAIRTAVPNAKLSVMYSPAYVEIADINKMADLGVAMVRCSMPHINFDKAYSLIKRGVDLGMISTANMTNVTEYNINDLVTECNKIIENGCSVIYLADSNGSMTPESVTSLFAYVKKHFKPVKFGFHNHNMLGMAMANGISAIQAGIDFIDGSLRGMGRSAGNVPTESLISYFLKTKLETRYDLRNILRPALYLTETISCSDPHPSLKDMAYGAYDFDSLLDPIISLVASEYDISWYSLIDKMAISNLDKPAINIDTIRKIAQEMINNN